MKKKLEAEYGELDERQRAFEKEKADFDAIQQQILDEKKPDK